MMYDLFERKLAQLLEDEASLPSRDEVIAMIKRDCQPWIRESKGNVVQRGQNSRGPFARIEVRQDRKPLDSSDEFHAQLIDGIKQQGLVANRDNSLFVTGSWSQAASFGRRHGQVYCVFPIGEFKYTWSEGFKDALSLQNALTSIRSAVETKKNGSGDLAPKHKHSLKVIEPLMPKIVQLRSDITDAVQLAYSSAELSEEDKRGVNKFVSEWGEMSDFLILVFEVWWSDDGTLDRLHKIAGSNGPSFVKRIDSIQNAGVEAFKSSVNATYRGDDGSLVQAIETQHEIMIHCKEAYIVATGFIDPFDWPRILKGTQ